MPSLTVCIKSAFDKLTVEERGLLWIVLSHGKKAEKEFGDRMKDPSLLTEVGAKVTLEAVVDMMQSAFKKCLRFVDELAGSYDDYGAQLDWVIRKVLVKSLEVTKPFFTSPSETFEGAMEREAWIREKLQEAMWNRLPDDVKRELTKVVEQMLKDKGVEPGVAARATGALLFGGLSAARTILGFQFHILAAQLSNLIMRVFVGHGLTVVGNALLQRLVAALFGPIGWVVTAILLVPTIVGLIWPRELDKYLPAVFVLASARTRCDPGSSTAPTVCV